MATRIKIKRGLKSSILNNINSIEQNEIVYSTDTHELAIRSDDANDGFAWQVAKDSEDIVIGYGAVNAYGSTSDYRNTIIGAEAYSASEATVALGQESSIGANANNSIVIGAWAEAYAGEASVPNDRAIAIGYNAKVMYNRGIAIGPNSSVTNKSISIGYGNTSNASNSISIGNEIGNNSDNHVQLGNSDVLTGNIGIYPINLVGKMSGSGTMETTTDAGYRRFRLSELNLSSLPINTKILLWIIPGSWGTTREVRTTNVDGSIAAGDIKTTIFTGDFNTASNGNYMRQMPLTILIEKLTTTTASVDIISMPMGLTTTSVSLIGRDSNINISTGNITYRAPGIASGNAIYYKWVVL